VDGDFSADDEKDDEDVVDTSALYGDDGVVDGGVTSGADPSGWDPINVNGNQ